MPNNNLKGRCSSYDEFSRLSKLADALIDGQTSSRIAAENYLQVADKLKTFMLTTDHSSLYTSKTANDLTLKELRMLKGPAYVGILSSIDTCDNDRTLLESAIVYMAQYVSILKQLEIFNDVDADSLVSADVIHWRDYQKHEQMLRRHKHMRERLLRRIETDCGSDDISTALEKLVRKRFHKNSLPGAQDVRKIFYHDLCYYAHYTIEQLFIVKCEVTRIRKEQEVTKAVIDMLSTHITTAAKEYSKQNNKNETSVPRAKAQCAITMRQDCVEEDDRPRASTSSYECPCQL
ncbi:hypothetical protein M514_08073 [Trichuris suis]|uniref:Uncharacterized protein n=1 Tax=Trichuris suis TaxID=68888 RepID=A0A085NUV0_9BILA|nr:hypothetical protein M513_08073 [Trichuris suis]KFD73246.1 hypothetical protein M514_08073 [Trichuris suis]